MALRRAARERGGLLPSIDVADARLDERRKLIPSGLRTRHFVNAPDGCVLNYRGLSAATGPGRLRAYDTRHPATHQSNPELHAYRAGASCAPEDSHYPQTDQSNPRMRDIETLDSELRLMAAARSDSTGRRRCFAASRRTRT